MPVKKMTTDSPIKLFRATNFEIIIKMMKIKNKENLLVLIEKKKAMKKIF